MNDEAREALRELVARYGPSLAEDPRRTRALLQDQLRGEQRLAIALIEAAAAEGVAAELSTLRPGELAPLRVGQLARRLERDRGLALDGAQWAVEAWADALGVTSVPEPEPEPEPESEPERPAAEPARPGVEPKAPRAPREPRVEDRARVIADLAPGARRRRRRRALAWSLAVLVALAGLIAFLVAVGSGGPSAVEKLRQHIPSDLRDCQTQTTASFAATASIQCFSAKGTFVKYDLFYDSDELSDSFGDELSVEEQVPCRRGADLVLPYHVRGAERGRVVCLVPVAGGSRWIYWTDRRHNILAKSFVLIGESSLATQLAEWACCLGPVEKPTDAPETKTLGGPQ